MPNAISALPGAVATGLAEVRELGLQGVVTLKADLAAAPVAKAVEAATDAGLPGQREILSHDKGATAWMAPDEVMLFCAYEEAEALTARLSDALKDTHHLAVNVSDARAMFSVDGPSAREVLAKLAPVDLHPDSFGPGEMRRTRLAQVPAAFWMTGPNAFRVVCFRSVARYVFDILALSAKEGGEVGYY